MLNLNNKKIKSIEKLNELMTLSIPTMFLYFNNISLAESQLNYSKKNVSFFSSRLFKSVSYSNMFNFGSFLITQSSDLSTLNVISSNIGTLGVVWNTYNIPLTNLKVLHSNIINCKNKVFYLQSLININSNLYQFFFNFFRVFFLFYKNIMIIKNLSK
jgi:hypothetical protein